MIPGIHGYAAEHQLVVPADLNGATVGISAELLAGLNSAEIMARLGSSSAGSAVTSSGTSTNNNNGSGNGSSGSTTATNGNNGSNGSGTTGANSARTSFIVVFDGPARSTPSRLDDGLERRRIVRALHDANIPFIVAPALAAAQLAHMFTKHYISHVAGADEALLWADVPLILDVFAEHPLVLRRAQLLNHLRLSEPAFVEVVLGVGQNAVVEASLPVLDKIGNPIESAIRNGIQYGGPAPPVPPPTTNGGVPPPPSPSISVYRAAQQLFDPAYLAILQRALTFVSRQPVLSEDGTVELQNKTGQPVPKDLTEVIGCQLAPEVYWYLNRGIIGPELLKGMLWAQYTDCYRVPLSPREPFEAFERLQSAISPLRQQAYALLVSQMHRYFQVKEVVNRTSGGQNFVRMTPEFPPSIDEANASVASIVAEAVRHARKLAQLPDDVPLSDMPEALARKSLATSGTPASVHVQITTLVLRQLVESVVFWYIATGKVSRSIDTTRLVHAFPWA